MRRVGEAPAGAMASLRRPSEGDALDRVLHALETFRRPFASSQPRDALSHVLVALDGELRGRVLLVQQIETLGHGEETLRSERGAMRSGGGQDSFGRDFRRRGPRVARV